MPVYEVAVAEHSSALRECQGSKSKKGHVSTHAFIVIVICGADDFVAITRFAKVKRSWLGKFVDLSQGIPSHTGFITIFTAIKPVAFERVSGSLPFTFGC